eukprot:1175589-Prorocentrum_minimum.AAC.1
MRPFRAGSSRAVTLVSPFQPPSVTVVSLFPYLDLDARHAGPRRLEAEVVARAHAEVVVAQQLGELVGGLLVRLHSLLLAPARHVALGVGQELREGHQVARLLAEPGDVAAQVVLHHRAVPPEGAQQKRRHALERAPRGGGELRLRRTKAPRNRK